MLSVQRIALAALATVTAVGAPGFYRPQPVAAQGAHQPLPIGATALHANTHRLAQRARPGHQLLIAAALGRHRQLSQALAAPVQRDGDMHVLVGVDAHDDLALVICDHPLLAAFPVDGSHLVGRAGRTGL